MPTVLDIRREAYNAIGVPMDAELFALQPLDNSSLILTSAVNILGWINDAAELLTRRCIALRGRRVASLLPGETFIPWADSAGLYPTLKEYPIGTFCLSDALGKPWGLWAAGVTEGLYVDEEQSSITWLRAARPDVLDRWRGYKPKQPIGIDPGQESPTHWAGVPEAGAMLAPSVGRAVNLVFDTLNLPVPATGDSSTFPWLSVGARRLIVCYVCARMGEVRRDDPTLAPRAAEFWAEFWAGVRRLYFDLPLDARGLFPAPPESVVSGKVAKG